MRKFFCYYYILSFILLSHSRAFTDLQILLILKSAASSGLHDWQVETKPFPPSPSSHCSFSGVSCNRDFRVISLNLTNVHFPGPIPPEVGFLNKLVNLTIAVNNLTGKLPAEMKNLATLKLLNISNNYFNGVFPTGITEGMKELEVLDVYNNNFSGPLPVSLVKLKNLRYMQLGGNYFDGGIPESYADFERLAYLGLNGNALIGHIPASLSRLSTLKELYLGYYNVYDGGIPPELGDLKLLEKLDLGSCNLTGKIPTALSRLQNLDSLFLQINRLEGIIPSDLGSLQNLKSLDLSVNYLTGNIPESFSNLKNLKLLHLFKNNLYGQIPPFIADLPNLEVLQIWENNFTLHIPPNLGANGRLKNLDVASNHLTGKIPRELCKGGRLQTLILMDNFFFGTIPEELGKCHSLTRVRLTSNFFSGAIPAGLFSLPLINLLELSDNYFTGRLPEKLSGEVLGFLALSNNEINGNIPPGISKLAALQTLSLEINRFTGEIPADLFNLKSLSKVNVSINNLTGELPISIVHCVSLTSLDISRNNLYGEIPVGISELKILSALNLSRNQFRGRIPEEIRRMISLTSLDLSDNNFFGTIPAGGQFLVFNDSAFSGNPNLCSPHHEPCPKDPSPTSGLHRRSMKLIFIITSLLASIFSLPLAFYKIYKSRQQKSIAWKLTAFQRVGFKAEDILACLKQENIIGKGGAGIVYHGSMPDGTDLAIKSLQMKNQVRSFSAEIETLGKIRHRNIVRLLGFVSNREMSLLLYEYMGNGSLGEMLHGSKGGELLPWEARCRIAGEAAKGLCYLHHDCSPRIIHRDVKSDNILLDSKLQAHVADFGLAKFFRDASDSMSAVAGSYGYIAPEYAYTLRVNEKSDVYSFGVVLLELLTGRKSVGEELDKGVDIVMWVRRISAAHCSYGVVKFVADPRLSGVLETNVAEFFSIAMMCVNNDSVSRPSMREVVRMLDELNPLS